MESGRLIAALTRMTRDLGLAEDLAQDALVAALEQWPAAGIPPNPGAWLMAAAKYRAIDHFRRGQMIDRKHEELVRELELSESGAPDLGSRMDDFIDDDLLRLIFIACHPILSTESQAALTLRLVCGLTTEQIARAFLATETTIAQRIVRAKKALGASHAPFEIPRGDEFHRRLSSVLQVIYLIFNEGYTATSGPDWFRPTLCEEALRIGRVLATLTSEEPEVLGLVALMEIQASRSAARLDENGRPVLLLEQKREKWDWLLIQHGLEALDRAHRLNREKGIYQLQAEIAACHARARTADETNWPHITALYDELVERLPSPVVKLSRAVAIGMAFGPEAGLELVDSLELEPALRNYHLLPSVRGDFLQKVGRFSEAAAEFERAASLTDNTCESDLLLDRARKCRLKVSN